MNDVALFTQWILKIFRISPYVTFLIKKKKKLKNHSFSIKSKHFKIKWQQDFIQRFKKFLSFFVKYYLAGLFHTLVVQYFHQETLPEGLGLGYVHLIPH